MHELEGLLLTMQHLLCISNLLQQVWVAALIACSKSCRDIRDATMRVSIGIIASCIDASATYVADLLAKSIVCPSRRVVEAHLK